MQSAPSNAGPPHARGSLVGGKYRVEEELGRGGMGVVLGATDLASGQDVALKVLRVEGLGDADTMRRLEREARALGKVTSSHVARVLHFGYEAGAPFLVLERLVGTTLAKVLHARGRLEIHEAIGLGREIALGLAAAHGASVVHRDLKPSNVFLADTAEGRVAKIIDFGVCAIETDGEATITRTAATVGTPSYMSPEQVTSPRDVDARADIWSLGVVLFEMLTGEKPFRGASMGAVFGAILSTVPPSVASKRPDCPDALADLVGRCLARDPGLRSSSADEVAVALSVIPLGDVRAAPANAPDYLPSAEAGEATATIPVAVAPAPMVAWPEAQPVRPPVNAPPRRAKVARLTAAAALLVLAGASLGALASRGKNATSPPLATTPSSSTSASASASSVVGASDVSASLPSTGAPERPLPPAVRASAVAPPAPGKSPKVPTEKKPKVKPGELDPRLIDTL